MCSFKHVFYDDMSQEGVDGKLQPPPPDALRQKRYESEAASDSGLWARADAANPDPARFCPVRPASTKPTLSWPAWPRLPPREEQQVECSDSLRRCK